MKKYSKRNKRKKYILWIDVMPKNAFLQAYPCDMEVANEWIKTRDELNKFTQKIKIGDLVAYHTIEEACSIFPHRDYYSIPIYDFEKGNQRIALDLQRILNCIFYANENVNISVNSTYQLIVDMLNLFWNGKQVRYLEDKFYDLKKIKLSTKSEYRKTFYEK